MIARSDIEYFANSFVSHFDNNLNKALSGEACFIFETGLDKGLDAETRLWLQTYIPHDASERNSLLQTRENAYNSNRESLIKRA